MTLEYNFRHQRERTDVQSGERVHQVGDAGQGRRSNGEAAQNPHGEYSGERTHAPEARAHSARVRPLQQLRHAAYRGRARRLLLQLRQQNRG